MAIPRSLLMLAVAAEARRCGSPAAGPGTMQMAACSKGKPNFWRFFVPVQGLRMLEHGHLAPAWEGK